MFQRLAQHVMIIPPPRITRKDCMPVALGRRLLIVELPNADDRTRSRHEILRMAPDLRAPVGEISHLARHTARGPFLIAREVVCDGFRTRHAYEFETTFPRQTFDRIGLHLLMVPGPILG